MLMSINKKVTNITGKDKTEGTKYGNKINSELFEANGATEMGIKKTL
jgi:hypothetical protein